MTLGRRAGRRMKGIALALIVLAACSSSHSGAPIAPVTAPSADAAMHELQARRAAFTGARSLLRVRAMANGKTTSFKAQLEADDHGRMRLTAYTPLNTPAITVFADGDRVLFLDHGHETVWRGDAREFAKSFGFFASALTPAQMALLILGLPPSDDVHYETAASGLARAEVGDVVVTFDPPSYPPRHVLVQRAAQRLEIEHLETAAMSEGVEAPEVPASYQCCVAPKL